MNAEAILGILIPFIGTSLGAAMVFVLKKNVSDNLQKVLTGFAAGVMVAASFWSLLAPAIEAGEGMGKLSFIPAAVGFLAGVGFFAPAGQGNAPYAFRRPGGRPEVGTQTDHKADIGGDAA